MRSCNLDPGINPKEVISCSWEDTFVSDIKTDPGINPIQVILRSYEDIFVSDLKLDWSYENIIVATKTMLYRIDYWS